MNLANLIIFGPQLPILWLQCSVLVLSTEFRTDSPIRTKLAGDYDNSSILRWQVRLLQIE